MADTETEDAQAVAPDELTEHVIESLAYNGNLGASLDDVWNFARDKVGELDKFQKNALWGWLMERIEDIVVTVDDGVTLGKVSSLNRITLDRVTLFNLSVEDLINQYHDKLRLFASEQLQWLTLTGKPKEGNAIGGMTFELLCLISASRDRGLTNVEIVRKSGQDARSLHGRTGALVEQRLIHRIPVIAEKCNTYLNIYRKFYQKPSISTNESRVSACINTFVLKRAIVNAVKEAKNGLRPVEDLKKEFGYDKQAKDHRYFSKTVRLLEAEGHVKRVIAVITGQKKIRAKCVQYVKDLADETAAGDNYNDSESSDVGDYSDNEELLDADAFADDTKDDVAAATDLVNKPDAQLNIVEASEALKNDQPDKLIVTDGQRRKSVLFNTIYPLETQILYAISQAGINGISARDICRNITGISYLRMVSRLLDQFVARSGSSGVNNKHLPPLHLMNLQLVRGTDFDARVKFYRFFTQTTYSQYVGKTLDPVCGTWGPAPVRSSSSPSYTSARDLNNAFRTGLPTNIKLIVDQDGNEAVAFHGDSLIIESAQRVVELPSLQVSAPVIEDKPTTGKKRGRPRKDQAGANNEATGGKRGRPPKRSAEVVVTGAVPVSDDVSKKQKTMSDIERQEPASATSQMDVGTNTDSNVDANNNEKQSSRVAPVHYLDTLFSTPSGAVPRSSGQDLLRENLVRKAQSTSTNATEPQSDLAKEPQNEPHNGLQVNVDLNFVQNKRDRLILDLLKKNDGVLEAGAKLAELMKDGTKGSMDRRTLNGSIDRLCMRGDIVCVGINTPNMPHSRQLLVDASISLNDPRVVKCKKQIIEREENRYKNPTRDIKGLTFVESEFSYYSMTDKNARISRAMDRLARAAEKNSKKSKKPSKHNEDQLEEHTVIKQEDLGDDDSVTDNGMEHDTLSSVNKQKRQRHANASSVNNPKERQKSKINKAVRLPRLSHSGSEQDMFYRLVIVSRAVYYSPSGVINWDAVVECWETNVAELTQERARALWQRVRDAFGGARLAERALQRWESIFLDAYQRGEFGTIEDPSEIDLFQMAKYWRTKEGELSDRNAIYLHNDHALNCKELNILEQHEKSNVSDMVSAMTSMVRTDEFLTEYAFGYCNSDHEIHGLSEDPDNKVKDAIKHAIKAVIATGEKVYDASVASKLLSQYDQSAVKSVLDELEHSKVIFHPVRDKEKPSPGPVHSFSDKYLSQLSFKVGDDIFSKATEADNRLFDILQSGIFLFPVVASDAEMIAILELIAYRRVKLQRSNTPEAGKLIEGYKSRHIEKEKLDFEVTLKFSGEAKSKKLVRPEVEPVPGTEQGPGRYTWIDIFGNVSEHLWFKILRPFIWTIMLRPGITRSELCNKWATVLTYEELDAILVYLQSCGCIKAGDGDLSLYSVAEGWFNGIAG